MSAYTCGMPCSSRSTSTLAESPSSFMVPSTCGSGRRATTTPATMVATSASTTTTATYADRRTHPGQSLIGFLAITSRIVP